MEIKFSSTTGDVTFVRRVKERDEQSGYDEQSGCLHETDWDVTLTLSLAEADELRHWLDKNLPDKLIEAKNRRRKDLHDEHERLFRRLEEIERELGRG